MRAISRFVRTKPLGVVGASMIIVWALAAVLASRIATASPTRNAFVPLQPPSRENWMGTDRLGRDVFSRVVHGARASISVGLGTVALALATSLLVGVSTAYVGGVADFLTQRVVDVIMSFPGLLLALLIATVLGRSLTNVIIAIAVGMTMGGIRLVRSQVFAEREKEYVQAARVTGCSRLRVCFRHITPNIMPVAMVAALGAVGGAIIAEAGLSFLGLGVPPPSPTWGMDLSAARADFTSAPWLAVFPGLALSSTVFAFNVFGDALRDALDPRLSRTGKA